MYQISIVCYVDPLDKQQNTDIAKMLIMNSYNKINFILHSPKTSNIIIGYNTNKFVMNENCMSMALSCNSTFYCTSSSCMYQCYLQKIHWVPLQNDTNMHCVLIKADLLWMQWIIWQLIDNWIFENVLATLIDHWCKLNDNDSILWPCMA